MNILQSIILGIVQGLTEFFPVSSSGHLVIFPYFFNWDYSPLYFTVTVHFATLAAILSVFYREAFRILRALILGIFRRDPRRHNDFKTGIYIIVASIPAAIVGFLLDDYIEGLFSKPLITALFLMGTAFILWLGEYRGKRMELHLVMQDEIGSNNNPSDGKESGQSAPESAENGRTMKSGFNLFIAIMAGLGQALAILPGISRSGATISFSRFFGVKRPEAVRFSFLMAIPVIFGSFILEIYRASDVIFSGNSNIIWELVTGFIFAYLSGFIAVKFMLYLTESRNLNIFAIYCMCLSCAVFAVYLFRRFV
ncbi:MAG: undecaprenyl-diphosphate phosphatase [Actinobacteria bacterium]|nr:undecaprenyl-diphosphate phosphatase [Actinomycetota bacterium]